MNSSLLIAVVVDAAPFLSLFPCTRRRGRRRFQYLSADISVTLANSQTAPNVRLPVKSICQRGIAFAAAAAVIKIKPATDADAGVAPSRIFGLLWWIYYSRNDMRRRRDRPCPVRSVSASPWSVCLAVSDVVRPYVWPAWLVREKKRDRAIIAHHQPDGRREGKREQRETGNTTAGE